MFIINITYKVSLDKIDEYLQSHIAYLEKQYELKNFIASGRKEPRIGGVILSKIDSKDKLKKIIKEDPFYQNDLADYEITQFIPTMTSQEFSILKEN
jgi:uncharacterized protein YciI